MRRTGSLAALLLAGGLAQGAPPAMVVYLPGVLNQSPQEVAAAATGLATAFSAVLPERQLEASFYRRPEDALAFLQTEGARAPMLLCDAAFLLDLPADAGFVPVARFAVSGSETHRKLVVVRSDGPLKRVADLEGKVVAAVPVPKAGFQAYLARSVFDDVLPPERAWFGRVEPAADEFAATAGVLYGGLDAAIVSERNPLLASKLGGELNAVHASGPLSLPVLAVRRSLLTPAFESALERAAESLGQPERRAILAGLRVDGLRLLPEVERAGLLRLPARRTRALEVAIPEPLPLAAPEVASPKPQELPFVAAVPIPEVPVVPEGAGGNPEGVAPSLPEGAGGNPEGIAPSLPEGAGGNPEGIAPSRFRSADRQGAGRSRLRKTVASPPPWRRRVSAT